MKVNPNLGSIRTEKSIENAMKTIKDWLSTPSVEVSGLDLIMQYDARQNIAVIKFARKGKKYEFRSSKQNNCRLNMHAIARVMEFKVRAHIMQIEDFDTSMSPYLQLEDKTGNAPAPEFKSNEKAYVVLGVSPLASNEEIVKHYKRMMKSFHPDMALSDDAKREFEKRTAEINEAYTQIKQERGL